MLSLWLIPGLLFGGSILPQVSWGVVFALVVIAVMTLGGVLIIRTARHKITVDSEGITDLPHIPAAASRGASSKTSSSRPGARRTTSP